MKSWLRSLHNLGIYLLPTFLLMTTGILLIALLYYPAPLTAFSGASRSVTAYGQAAVDEFVARSLDALQRPLQMEQQPQARTLMYRYERDAAYRGEQPAVRPWALAPFENRGDFNRSALIRL